MNFSLHPVDWITIAVFLAASFVIGLIARKKIASLDDFLLLGRKLGKKISPPCQALRWAS
jgi:Na+/proline symporter